MIAASAWLAVSVVHCYAFAQAPDAEQVFSPLLDQAERDQTSGQAALARARARAFLERVSVGSALAGRAHLVINATTSAEGSAAPSSDVVYEPLVIAAEADGAAGRQALSLARLSAAMSLAPADSPLAARARNVYALVSRSQASGSAGAAHAAPPPAPVAPPQTQAAPPPQVIVVTPQAAAPPPQAPVIVHTQTTPTLAQAEATNGDRRRATELAELRAAGAVFGVLTGIYVLSLMDAEDPLLYFAIPVFTGLGFAIATEALDTGDGAPSGVPAAISTGMLLGFGDGLLIWGVARNDLDGAGSVLNVLVGATAAGGLIGGLFGYGLRPTIAESRLMLSVAAWSVWIGLMGGVAFGDSADATWTSGLVTYNVGIATAMLIASASDVSLERVAFINAGVAGGALMGLFVAGVLYGAQRKGDERRHHLGTSALGACLAIGSAAGLLMGLALPDDEIGGSRSSLGRSLAELDVDFAIAPRHDGVTLGLIGRL